MVDPYTRNAGYSLAHNKKPPVERTKSRAEQPNPFPSHLVWKLVAVYKWRGEERSKDHTLRGTTYTTCVSFLLFHFSASLGARERRHSPLPFLISSWTTSFQPPLLKPSLARQCNTQYSTLLSLFQQRPKQQHVDS